jgi:hypothetical protein
MAELQKIAGETNQAQVGKRPGNRRSASLPVEFANINPGVARTQWDAPEIDGSIVMDPAMNRRSAAQVGHAPLLTPLLSPTSPSATGADHTTLDVLE